MKVAPLITVALILCIAFPGPIQAKKKFCVGKDGNKYAVGQGYDDNDGKACVRYKCVKRKKKSVMKKGKCVENGEWSSWSIWSACSATCGSSTRKRKRTCSSPAPSNGGKPCSGPEEEIEECSNPSCGPDMNVKVDSLELNFQSLNDSVQTIQTTMMSVMELMTTMQSSINKQGTCMSDFSSLDCPYSAPGKIGVVDGINSNKAGINNNTAGVMSNKDDINTNKVGINTNEAGIASTMADINTNKADVNANKASINTNTAGVMSNKDDINTNKAGITSTKADINTNKADVNANKASILAHHTGCEMVNINFYGNDIPDGLSTHKNWQSCQLKCQTNPNCTHWTFRNSDGNCWLKSGNYTQSEENGLVSGPRACLGPGENVNVTALELSVESLNELMTTLQSTADKQGTCMMDLSSSDCPDSAPGKIGVVDGIHANKAGINTNEAGITSNEAGIKTNKAGITSTKADINTNKAGIMSTKTDINTNKAGINTNKAGITSTKADINANKADINTNKADINTNKADINTNKADINTNKDDITDHHRGAELIHTDANYQYYKVPVPASSKMLSALIVSTCSNFGLTPQCFHESRADSNCVQAPSGSYNGQPPSEMAKILCGMNDPSHCASTLNMFWYMKQPWDSGSACGATISGGYCTTGKDYTSTIDTPYFAACLKHV